MAEIFSLINQTHPQRFCIHGKDYKGTCPRCKRGQFYISKQHQTFYCYGCGFGGTQKDWKQYLEEKNGTLHTKD